ncbi:MAG TPA: hypothetical protein VFS86_00375 [Rhodanobacteraceae bacterium]|nr:hypothetical protein [Rhodanobacteraceae bacterium]
MFDPEKNGRPRVALVFGDAGAAQHLRAAVSSHVQIVYDTAAAEFDVARLADAHATAALVNLGGGDWLDAVESRLRAAGVAVVYNDPEISRGLEGWAQARWLRHLTAKLRGSADYDPPRPVTATQSPSAHEPDAVPSMVVDETGNVTVPIVERPLSPVEIASMTVDFGAGPTPIPPPAARGDEMAVPPHDDGDAADGVELQLAALETDAPVSVAGLADPPDAMPQPAVAPVLEPEAADALDVDTEALSAQIDARLAATDDHASPESPAVWRIVQGGGVSPVELAPDALRSEGVAATPAGPSPAAPVDDAEVLNALPSLDDWQLVDPSAPDAPALSPKRDEHELPAVSFDLAGLELVPMEPVVQVELQPEPSGRWMHDVGGQDRDGGTKGRRAVPGAKGSHA